MDLHRQKNETLHEYKVRLCQCKEEENLTWKDIRDLLILQSDYDGEPLSPDTIRKWWSVWSEGFVYGLDSKISDSEILEEVESKRIELQKAKYQLQDQKRELNNAVRNQARFDHIKDELLASLKELSLQKPIIWSQPPTQTGDREGVMIFGDWHYGMFVDNGFNKYDKEEFARRVDKLTIESIQYAKENKITKLHVVINGDLINGGIHVSSRVNSVESSIKQIMHVSECVSEIIAKYASEFNSVDVYNTLDNHSRLFPNKGESTNDENLASIIPWYIKSRLSHVANVKVLDNPYSEIAVFDVMGHNIMAVHGHRDKPENVVQNLSLMTKKVPGYVLINHYHHSHELEVNGVYVIMSSSMCGTDEYSENIRKSNNPAQKLLIFNKTGRVCTYNIRLD